MILVCGIPSEPPVARVVDAAEELGVPVVVVNQRQAAWYDVTVAVDGTGPAGTLTAGGTDYPLAGFAGVYLRLTDPTVLPEQRRAAGQAPETAARVSMLTTALGEWCEITPARVANRLSAMASNAAKPYQTQLIHAAGFGTPPTLVTNDPAAVREFAAAHGRVVYKSTSSVRSVVRELTDARDRDLDRVRALPTQFQAYLQGTDVRVHVVGEEVFACEVRSAAVDYRYAGQDGLDVEMRPVRLPAQVAERCRQVAALLGLPLVGLDLLVDPDGTWWCFEANPSPAYSCFEEPTGLPIAAALVRWLETGRAGPAGGPAVG
ncbi:MAG: hypothetical protein ACOYY2_09280 [Actinomycetota bacterium]